MVMRKIWFMLIAMILLPMSATACGFGEKSAEGYENTAVKHAYQHWNQGASSAVAFVFIDNRFINTLVFIFMVFNRGTVGACHFGW